MVPFLFVKLGVVLELEGIGDYGHLELERPLEKGSQTHSPST